MSKSYLNNATLSRGLRNNNPGNLVKTNISWQGKVSAGKDAKFEQFENIYFGLRAMYKDLINDINKGKNTVRRLVSEYAPSNENDTALYITKVSKALGISPDAKIKSINVDFLVLLGRAIVNHENGKGAEKYVTDLDLKKSLSMLGNVSTPNLKVNISDYTTNILKVVGVIVLPLTLFFYTYITLTL